MLLNKVCALKPIEAQDGCEALSKITNQQFDLLITDITMPRITGDRLAKKILALRPDFPIIACTGYSEKLTELSVKKIGIRALIMKPIVRKELAETIRQVLDSNQDLS